MKCRQCGHPLGISRLMPSLLTLTKLASAGEHATFCRQICWYQGFRSGWIYLERRLFHQQISLNFRLGLNVPRVPAPGQWPPERCWWAAVEEFIATYCGQCWAVTPCRAHGWESVKTSLLVLLARLILHAQVGAISVSLCRRRCRDAGPLPLGHTQSRPRYLIITWLKIFNTPLKIFQRANFFLTQVDNKYNGCAGGGSLILLAMLQPGKLNI